MITSAAFPNARPAHVVSLGDLPLGPCRAAPDAVEPGASQAEGNGLTHAPRISVCIITSGTATEIDRLYGRFPFEAASAYLRDNRAALDAAVAEAGGDSAVTFGLLDNVAVVSDA